MGSDCRARRLAINLCGFLSVRHLMRRTVHSFFNVKFAMMNLNIRRLIINCLICCLLVISVRAVDFYAPILKGFRYPEYDKEGRLKFEVLGEEAQMQSDDKIFIKNPHLIFYENERATAEISAAECLFDRKNKIVSSTAAVTMVHAHVELSGEGFLWRGEDNCFIISNRTRVVLKNTP